MSTNDRRAAHQASRDRSSFVRSFYQLKVADRNETNATTNDNVLSESTPLPVMKNNEESRLSSWYEDALNQTEKTDQLDDLFGIANSTGNDGNTDNSDFTFDDGEILEQYRIMAQHQALSRVKEIIGFDRHDYEKKKKFSSNDDQKKLPSKATCLPEPILIKSTVASPPKPEEPSSIPALTFKSRFMHQRMDRVPDLCCGTPSRGTPVNTMPPDEHSVRCLGCRAQLRVKLLATLVSCPECNTVSSATSTRR